MNEKFYEFKEKRKGSKIPLKREFFGENHNLTKVKKKITSKQFPQKTEKKKNSNTKSVKARKK